MMQKAVMKRLTAVVGSVAVGISGLAVLGLAASPAQAATSGEFSCIIPGLVEGENALKLPVDLDADLPYTEVPGTELADKSVTGKIKMSDDLAGLLSSIGATKVNATVTGTLDASGTATGYTASKNDIAVQATAFDVDFVAPIAPHITTPATGETVVTAGSFDLKVDLFDNAGPLASISTVTLTCSPPADLAPVDTVRVANYSCLALGVLPVAIEVTSSTDLPGEVSVGVDQPVTLTSDVVLGPDLAGLMAAFGVASVDAAAQGTVQGTDGPHTWSNTQTGLTVPATGATVPLQAAIDPAVNATASGDFKLSAGPMNLKVTTYNADGTPHGLGVLELPCEPVPAAQVISSATATVPAVAIETTTTVALTPDKLTANGTATATAKVTAASGTPTGSVTFTWAGGSETVALTGDTASVSIPDLKAGDLTVTAAFVPDSTDFAGSQGDVTVTVAPAGTTTAATSTTVKLSPAKLTAKGTATATATVTSAGGKPTGSVRFSWNGGSKTVVLVGGSAKAAITGLRAGTLKVTASYVPSSSSFAASSATKSAAVARIKTKTKVKAAGKFRKAGKAVITVSGKATGAVTLKATGTLKKTFKAKVRNGKATIKLGKLKKKGKITLVATFKGNATHAKSVSKKVVLRVK